MSHSEGGEMLVSLKDPQSLWAKILISAPRALRAQRQKDDPLQKSYLATYPVFLQFFRAAAPLSRDHVIIGAALTYSWMPRAMRLDDAFAEQAAASIDQLRDEPSAVSAKLIEPVARLLSGSVVGASKLLHFAAPADFPIWDQRVARAVGWPGTLPSGLSCMEPYLHFLSGTRLMLECPESARAAEIVADYCGYAVTPLRALELLLFVMGASAGDDS